MLVAVIAGHGHVVTFKRGGRRQYNIGMLRRRGPEALRDHHQLRLLPGADQAISVLVMGKVGSARPPDEANIREVAIQTVVLIEDSWIF